MNIEKYKKMSVGSIRNGLAKDLMSNLKRNLTREDMEELTKASFIILNIMKKEFVEDVKNNNMKSVKVTMNSGEIVEGMIIFKEQKFATTKFNHLPVRTDKGRRIEILYLDSITKIEMV